MKYSILARYNGTFEKTIQHQGKQNKKGGKSGARSSGRGGSKRRLDPKFL
ncbi:MAG: hypothetical protein ACW97Z_09605 [Candidatus Hodarchaeales archaeon]|jgi:hypothetical protein